MSRVEEAIRMAMEQEEQAYERLMDVRAEGDAFEEERAEMAWDRASQLVSLLDSIIGGYMDDVELRISMIAR